MTTIENRLRDRGMTLREVARELGISPARVLQIENRAIEKLRSIPWMRRRLELFVDFDTTSRAKEGSHR